MTNNRLIVIILFYPVNKQAELQSQFNIEHNSTQEGPHAKKKEPCCRKCHHPETICP